MTMENNGMGIPRKKDKWMIKKKLDGWDDYLAMDTRDLEEDGIW